jgi:histidine triad (HIT) family protein
MERDASVSEAGIPPSSKRPMRKDRACTFCAIAAGDLDAEIVVETEHTVSFLDKSPLFKGHTLVVPRQHVVTLRDLPDELVVPYFTELRRITAAVQDGCGADGSFVAENNVVSQSVAHLHFHVVPRVRKDGLRGFFWPRQRYADGEAAEYAARIRAYLSME